MQRGDKTPPPTRPPLPPSGDLTIDSTVRLALLERQLIDIIDEERKLAADAAAVNARLRASREAARHRDELARSRAEEVRSQRIEAQAHASKLGEAKPLKVAKMTQAQRQSAADAAASPPTTLEEFAAAEAAKESQ